MPIDTDQTIHDARKVANDVSKVASNQFTSAKDGILSFTQDQPLIALIAAAALGLLLGKIVL